MLTTSSYACWHSPIKLAEIGWKSESGWNMVYYTIDSDVLIHINRKYLFFSVLDHHEIRHPRCRSIAVQPGNHRYASQVLAPLLPLHIVNRFSPLLTSPSIIFVFASSGS